VTSPSQENARPNISGRNWINYFYKLQSNSDETPNKFSPTKLCEQQFRLTHLSQQICSEQTVDILNPPDRIKVYDI